MTENRKLKVFLCHSKDDKPKVRELYRRLVADGFDAWLDEEKLIPGQEWDLEIRKAVQDSDVVVVCLSNGSITQAGYVQKEIRFALDVADEQPEGTIFIIPARLEDCQVPSRLNKWQWVNLFEKTSIEKLNHALNLRAKGLGSIVIPTYYPLMVHIPAGNFLMGSTSEQVAQAVKDGLREDWAGWEQPQHVVELSEYFIGKFPVTNREYQAFIRDTEYTPPANWAGDQFHSEKDEHPVINVSWSDATAYCRWLNKKSGKPYRLPTEAEWEKAARGEDGLIFPWGNIFDSRKANTWWTSIGDTSEVGQFSPHGDSPYGCADIIGNVWEWCNDWCVEDEYKNRAGKSVKDPQGPPSGPYRVLRGGSFETNLGLTRCAYRHGSLPSNFGEVKPGFRVVLSPSKE